MPPRDPAAFAVALARVAASREMIARLGNEGRKRVHAMFSVSRMVTATERVYLDLIEADTKVAA